VNVLVDSAYSSIYVTPSTVTMPQGYSQQFIAAAYDQFGTLIQPQPNFTWSVASGGPGGSVVGSNTTALYTSPASTFGIDHLVVQGGAVTATVNITVTQPPTIRTQPSNVSVNAGQTATFTAAAVGYPAPTVQWYVSTDGGGTFSAIAGATSTTLSFTATGAQNGNIYEAVFTNAAGTATTSLATLAVASTQAQIVAVKTSWGADKVSATLFTAADGLRLLPVGRNTDLPWLSVNKLTITLSAPATLSPSDISITGIAVANYGPVTITGSGTTYTITFGRPIVLPDRVTVTIANAGIITYTRRLDVLPGDIDDSGVVDNTDILDEANLYLNGGTSGGILLIYGDLNGDGTVDNGDYTLVKARKGTRLP
jgi:hypothetical protein